MSSKDLLQEPNEYSTQLADAKPRFDCPIRVAFTINTPNRLPNKTHDQLIQQNAFSATAIETAKKWLESNHQNLKNNDNYNFQISSIDFDAQIQTSIKDFYVVAQTSKRANKKQDEGEAYVSLGVIYDNLKQYHNSIEQYMKYLMICETTNDIIGIATSCNCLGVNYMLLASPHTDAGTLNSFQNNKNDKSIDLINKAIEYHLKHLQIGPDMGGKYVAHTNLGKLTFCNSIQFNSI